MGVTKMVYDAIKKLVQYGLETGLKAVHKPSIKKVSIGDAVIWQNPRFMHIVHQLF